MLYAVKLEEAELWVPPKHTKTLDKVLIAGKNMGAKNFTLLYGILEPGGAAEPHHHEVEQGYYILEGAAHVKIEDEKFKVGPDTAVFIPVGAEHTLTVVGDKPLKLLTWLCPPAPELQP